MKISKTLYIRYLFALLLPLSGLLQACDMIEYHPYDLDIDGETEVNARNIQRIETALDGKKEFSFAVISDTQRWYDETEDAVADMNEKGGIDFVVHTGDLSDFGMKLEFEKQRDILNGLSVPYVCLLGNHDCLATGKEVFNRIFGEENFSFTAGDVLFICLNTNALEFDYSDAIPDFSFLEKLLKTFHPTYAEQSLPCMPDRIPNSSTTMWPKCFSCICASSRACSSVFTDTDTVSR